jgi:hypothetical protein
VDKIFKIKAGSAALRFAASAGIHVILFFIITLILNTAAINKTARSMYVQVSTGLFTKEISPEKQNEELLNENSEQIPDQKPELPPEKNVSYFYSDKDADTTSLNNVYSEKTLNVNIKYPAGWTFIDQNVKNKLDGVTFWGLTNVYNPPPYIHLEVKEKYLFNPSRFKYNKEYDDYVIYYNDPEEMADQFTQIIYIRTEDDEDFSLKLIMKGKENFRIFQPVFFGMLKTFDFGG